MKRFAIIGNGAAGKTTLARAPSERLSVPHYEVGAVQYRLFITAARARVFVACDKR